MQELIIVATGSSWDWCNLSLVENSDLQVSHPWNSESSACSIFSDSSWCLGTASKESRRWATQSTTLATSATVSTPTRLLSTHSWFDLIVSYPNLEIRTHRKVTCAPRRSHARIFSSRTDRFDFASYWACNLRPSKIACVYFIILIGGVSASGSADLKGTSVPTRWCNSDKLVAPYLPIFGREFGHFRLNALKPAKFHLWPIGSSQVLCKPVHVFYEIFWSRNFVVFSFNRIHAWRQL
jgi:hypothetical protein